MSSVISVVVHPIKPVKSIRLYRVELEDGTVLVDGARDPEFAACRALLAKRIKGTLQTRHHGSPTICMRIGIKWGATRGTAEGPTVSVREAKWQPFEGIKANAPNLELLAA